MHTSHTRLRLEKNRQNPDHPDHPEQPSLFDDCDPVHPHDDSNPLADCCPSFLGRDEGGKLKRPRRKARR
ncbi:MAG: hypothetical protein H0T47_18590 [Planctomycetaceae bacterium]|nr:hypothetical protein [Planctomycetaceae bacterium]